MPPLVEVEGLRVSARDDGGRGRADRRGRGLHARQGRGPGAYRRVRLRQDHHRPRAHGLRPRAACRIAGGRIRLGDTEVLSLPTAGLRGLRGRRVSYVAQSATAAFNPSRRIMDQVVESRADPRRHGPRAGPRREAVALFRSLALPEPERIGARYPHQVSGGQLQRLMAAMALITGPDLVILDEPTTALDVTTQIEVLRAFKEVVRERGVTAVYVSHDLAVVAQIADRILVLRRGRMQETGPTERILAAARAPLHAEPARRRRARRARREHERGGGSAACSPSAAWSPATAGSATACRSCPCCGTWTCHPRGAPPSASSANRAAARARSARVVAGLLPMARGEMRLGGETLPPAVAQRTPDQLRRVQLVFQSADAALNPTRPVRPHPRPAARLLPRAAGSGAATRSCGACSTSSTCRPTARPPARRALRRAEAAGEPRARPRGRARPDPLRRGDLRARHGGRRRHPRADGRAPARPRPVHHVHQPRPAHGARGLRRGDGALRRQPRWRRAAGEAMATRALASLHGAADRLRARAAPRLAGGSGRGARAGSAGGRARSRPAPSSRAAPCGSRASATGRRRRRASLSKGARILCHRTEEELRRMLPERPHRAAALAGARLTPRYPTASFAR